ncbi:MAG TPA: L-threonylcarbamoyladenylate synthase [Streptosporangiaceae bacterium]|nr:L-threonylcarbamoyladenylate synthase [Streptosporangiaceae bacterium]
MQVFDCLNEETRTQGIAAAVSAIFSQKLVVMPTDTSYALVGYAFGETPASAIRTAKAVGESTPLQVLISDKQVLDGISMQAPEHARMLADAFWPGPMTLIVPASPSLRWHVGGDERYVQVRVPDQEVAIELLGKTGPMVASAARPAASEIVEGQNSVGDLEEHTAVFLDNGPIPPGVLSTVVDCTAGEVTILRKGKITVGQIVDVLGYMPLVLG